MRPQTDEESAMNSHAHNLHDGVQAGGLALGYAFHRGVLAHQAARREQRSQASATASVDRLGQVLLASRAREAALAAEVASLRAALATEQGRTRQAVARACAAEGALVRLTS